MQTKLTLKLNKDIIKKTKIYAEKSNTSLSKLVENYFSAIVSETKQNYKNRSPLINELSGVIKPSTAEDHKKEYADYLNNKYK